MPVCSGCLAEPEPFEAEHFCVACRTPFRNAFPLDEEGRCGLCRRGLTGYDAAYSYGAYEGRLRGLIHLYKYGRIETLAGPLANLLAAAYPRDQRFDLIAPVPLHWRRRWQRGFNQAELLARRLGERLGIPARGVLRRRRPTRSQSGLSNAARRANVAGAFELKARTGVRGLRVLLVDDVLTTGASAGACARALKQAGARHVAVLSVARADRRFPAGRGTTVPGPDSFALGAP